MLTVGKRKVRKGYGLMQESGRDWGPIIRVAVLAATAVAGAFGGSAYENAQREVCEAKYGAIVDEVETREAMACYCEVVQLGDGCYCNPTVKPIQ